MASIIQSAANATTVAAQATLLLTPTAATNNNNTLLLGVYAVGTAPAQPTLPAGWQLIQSANQDAGAFMALFLLPAGNGSLASVTITFAGTTNAGAAFMVELSEKIPAAPYSKGNDPYKGAGEPGPTNTALVYPGAVIQGQSPLTLGSEIASSTTFPAAVTAAVPISNDDLWLIFFAHATGGALVGNLDASFIQVGDATSTAATGTNCHVRAYLRTQISPATFISPSGHTLSVATEVGALLHSFAQYGAGGPAVGPYGSVGTSGYSGAGGTGW